MSRPIPDAAQEHHARPQLVFVLTIHEHNQLEGLRAFGESLMAGLLEQRSAPELPPGLVKAMDGYGEACADWGLAEEGAGPMNETSAASLHDRPELLAALGLDPDPGAKEQRAVKEKRTDLEVEIRASIGVMEKNEIGGRAMAFLAGIPETEFRARIEGSDLALCMIPPMMPCLCTQKRVQTACAVCKGQRMVPTVIPPAERIKPRAEVEAQFPPGRGGGPALVDANGRPLPRA